MGNANNKSKKRLKSVMVKDTSSEKKGDQKNIKSRKKIKIFQKVYLIIN